MEVSLIAAMGENRAIGFREKLPWPPLPADWANLARVTEGKPMVMGRKSYDSPDRVWSRWGNAVVTRQPNYPLDEGFQLTASLDEALKLFADRPEVFIIGGAQLFAQAMPLARRIHLTVVTGTFVGDAFFPPIPADFRLVAEHEHPADERNPLPFALRVYERP